MEKQAFLKLIDKYLAGSASAEEAELLINYYNSFQANKNWDEAILGDAKLLETDLLQKIKQNIAVKQTPVKRIVLWKRIAAAASIVLMLGIGSYLLLSHHTKQDSITKTNPFTTDILPPHSTKAMITLANGQKVMLDSINNGMLAKQGNVNVVKTADGQVIYNGVTTETQYNTLFNPKGSKVVNITLQDGTKVWLNNESSITYPTAFIGNQRNVTITGETYFEVAKDPTKKFTVTGNGTTTEVLGTHFNMNTYADENNSKVTLLEGSVKVTKGALTGMLVPGQQAQIGADIKVVENVDVDEVMAWKNGEFQFGEKADIAAIMRQLSRWYNVTIEYNGNFTGHIGGSISRDVNISEVLMMLEKTGGVTFKIEGNKITVMP